MTQPGMDPSAAVAHLRAAVWEDVNRRLVAKAIGEFAHELLIEPKLARAEGEWGHYVLATDRPEISYRFRARVLSLEHWQIDLPSLRKYERAEQAPLDALRLIIELRAQLAIAAETLPEYLEELTSTLYAAAYKRVRPALCVEALARADFQSIETAMTEGHPSFVANNGRLGWSAPDYFSYAPEAAEPLSLVWLAARKTSAEFAAVCELSYRALLERELGTTALEQLCRPLRERGLDESDFILIPVHPWQWENKLIQLFASDLAAGDLVYLGPGDDRYLAQQSIRTFFNISRPERCYVKTALSILNMGFTRGIPASITASAAAVNDWVSQLVARDGYLSAHGFSLLREVAFVAYRHCVYEAAISARSTPYKEMLAALWRESPTHRLRPRQRVLTMAALLHVDREGGAFLPALIRASGASVDSWLQLYLRHYLKPLLHCFYAYNLVFTPHCENTILVLEEDLPAAVILKDLAEDIGVLNPEQPLPAAVARLALQVPEALMTLAIFTDVFDCVFRYLAALLYEHADYAEQRFWHMVGACIRDYQREQPQFEAKFRRYDLFAASFPRNCLNRLQLRNNRQMVDLNAPEPVDSLQLVGSLQNPIASFRDLEVRTS